MNGFLLYILKVLVKIKARSDVNRDVPFVVFLGFLVIYVLPVVYRRFA